MLNLRLMKEHARKVRNAGETARATIAHKQFAKQVGQAFSLPGLLPRAAIGYLICLLCAATVSLTLAQDASTPAKAPLDHVIGTITAVDKTAHTVTVKEDKTDASDVINLEGTKTLLKVEPTAKDLKNAVRITADDLESGDRVDVRGTKTTDSPTTLNARSVILMSARDLEKTHQEQAAAWAHATSGRVTAVDAASGKITAEVRSAGATNSITVQTNSGTEFTRYAPETGKAAPSQISQLRVGDQLKVIGDKTDDGSVITAKQLYSGAFRTISATVTAVAADGKSITVKDLASKKDETITLSSDVAIHKLPPMMAGFLARRLNPSAAATAGAPGAGGAPAGGAATAGGPPAGWKPPEGAAAGGNGMPPGAPGGSGMGGSGMGGSGRGDISQMIDRTPTIPLTDLKPGDAVVISGVATGADNSQLMARTIVAGVEPILQSTPKQQGGGRSVGGDWGLGEISAPQ